MKGHEARATFHQKTWHQAYFIFKAILESPYTNPMKNNYPKTVRIFFIGRSIFSYFLGLYCYNFRITLTNSINLRF